jgi:hypothetical protein
MKNVLICSVAALAVLVAAGTAMTTEKAKVKGANKRTEAVPLKKKAAEQKKLAQEKKYAEQKKLAPQKKVAVKKGLSEKQKQLTQRLKAMAPEQRRLALAKRTLQDQLAPWQEVRKIAAKEKAVKTLAAIDKIIAGRQQQFKKKMEAAKKPGPVKSDKQRQSKKKLEAKKKQPTKPAKPKGEGKRSSGQETAGKTKASVKK